MLRARIFRPVFFLTIAAGLLGGTPARPRAREKPIPRPRAVAETRLLMQGINLPNYEGLQRLLRKKPADAAAWSFLRGQALLIAENGNLLMLRPPRNEGRDAWLDQAADLRDTATRLARAAAGRDYKRSRAGLLDLAHSCDQCHQTFRVKVDLTPFQDEPKQDRVPKPERGS